MRSRRPIKVAFIALGCVKNLVDSEKMLGQLAESGALVGADEADADVIVINTCGFLEAARAEAHEEIAAALERKRRGPCCRVVVAGCLVQRDGEKLLEVFPEIDALVGVHRRDDVARAALNLRPAAKGRKGRRRAERPEGAKAGVDLYLGEYHPHVALDTARLRITPRHYAYLRISEGCEQKCTFCTIPAIRGPMRSKPPEVVLAEARELVEDGAFELNLIGQDTTGYGRDIGYAPGLAGLLRELDKVPGVGWLRLLYAHPSRLTDEMIDAIAECERVVEYIDLPLQHINDRILKAMHRGVTRVDTESLLARLRGRIPGVAIRTTFIAGFPGETEEEFEELLAFVREAGFSAVGVFPYSREPDTPAGRMDRQLPEEVKQARGEAIMESQREIALAEAAGRKGELLDVLIDGQAADGQSVGRHAGQAPQVDAVTYVCSNRVHPGECVRVVCEGSEGYDLIARPTDAILPIA